MIPALPPEYTHPMSIGQGGFASVYRVKQAVLDRWVAVKIIKEKNPQKRKVLLKEGRTQANLQFQYVPQIYDAFEWKKNVYIVMQWIKGVSLYDLMKNNLSDDDKLVLADTFIHALSELHTSGYAHRDLKPQNIIISPQQGMYFVDFAFAKHRDDKMVSMEGKVKGTPAYMAPELWRGDNKVDYIRADLYSAGVILNEILTDKKWQALVAGLIDVNPGNRPGSASDLIEQWQALTEDTIQNPDWAKLAGAILKETLTEGLNRAAQDLMLVKRFDEAYWLLVESLEEDPDDPETILLMQKAAKHPRKKRKIQALTYGGIALVLLTVFVAFYLGRQTGKAGSLTEGIHKTARKAQTGLKNALSEKRQVVSGSLPFLADTVGRDALTGLLCLVDYPQKGNLLIDGKVCAGKQIPQGILLPGGTYTLAWKNEGGAFIWRERVLLLPFQKKVINMPVKNGY